MASIVYLLCFLFALLHAVIAVRQCYVFPIPHAGGRAQKLDCTSNPGHDYAASGCFYRRYADDSGLQAGFVEGGCGASMCNSGREEKNGGRIHDEVTLLLLLRREVQRCGQG
ncbi:hypothetical protein PRIPAC_94358 [Pristionchus pacificus]|uniref:Uncharacterized protein n=1 Tax=Pristionchus pacificus TaxID=54126 RepID=A0A2A6BQ29_PRIPA|nr:hypothetical protein PRIPAC_94358 [Pristionchus pacificus]|eukprot:PDM67871.1 hypothetical protein PRIPAC_45915 [Pristionchus pacificus]